MKTLIPILGQIIFWLWNLTFLGWAYLLLLPLIGVEVLRAAWSGAIPSTFTLSLLGLVAIPTIASGMGFRYLRSRPTLLLRLFYGVELPLFGLCLLRMFVLRELTPVSTGFLVFLVWGMVAFTLELGAGYAVQSFPLGAVQLVSQSVTLMLGLYGGALLMLYGVPSLCALGYQFLQFLGYLITLQWVGPFFETFFHYPYMIYSFAVGLGLLILTAGLFLVLPFAFCHLYTRSWWRIGFAFAQQYGWGRSLAFTGATLGVLALAFTLAVQSPQPQTLAFRLLAIDPALVQSDPYLGGSPTVPLPPDGPPDGSLLERVQHLEQVDRSAVLAQLDAVRSGLVNAYLYHYRYLSPEGQVNGLAKFYENTTVLRPSLIAALQKFHNFLISPFLYQGQGWDDDIAAELYAQVFDTPIQRGEREAIQAALQATANRSEAKAGLVDLYQQVIPLTQQKVSVKVLGDAGEVTIQERYENPTWDNEEIFYSFSLPESAVITGLWLGDDENLQRYPGVIASRGAAQEVYNAQVQRQVDPALLEQVGPRQYRLRVFPIPARSTDTQAGHGWVTWSYQVLPTAEGWPLPQAIERRNGFWDQRTVRERQGQKMARQSWDPDRGWFEAAFRAETPLAPQPHRVTLGDQTVIAEPLPSLPLAPLRGIPSLAVVIDGSYSMAQQAPALQEALRKLAVYGEGVSLDVYRTAAPGDSPQALGSLAEAIAQGIPQSLPFYGRVTLGDMVQQWEQLQPPPNSPNTSPNSPNNPPNSPNTSPYQGILLMTDGGSYELERDDLELSALGAPLWLVHLGGQLPGGYSDPVLAAIEASGGGVTTDVSTALQRLMLESNQPQGVQVVDGYRWQVQPLDRTQANSPASTQSNSPVTQGNSPASTQSNSPVTQANSPASTQANSPVTQGNSLATQANFPATQKLDRNPDPFAPLAARHLIRHQTGQLDLKQLANLDAVHRIAQTYHIVSPYSSLLALVNDDQREQLAAAEQQADRFDREVETGTETLTQPGNPVSVPETGTLLGLVAGGGILLGGLRRYSRSRRLPLNF